MSDFPSSLVRSATVFLKELAAHNGNENAMATWDSMRAAVGEDFAGAVLFGMLTGHTSRVRLGSGRTDRKIEAIKEFRWLTGVGLKEAKDAIESSMAYGRAQTFEVPKNTDDQVAEQSLRNLRALGFDISWE